MNKKFHRATFLLTIVASIHLLHAAPTATQLLQQHTEIIMRAVNRLIAEPIDREKAELLHEPADSLCLRCYNQEVYMI